MFNYEILAKFYLRLLDEIDKLLKNCLYNYYYTNRNILLKIRKILRKLRHHLVLIDLNELTNITLVNFGLYFLIKYSNFLSH